MPVPTPPTRPPRLRMDIVMSQLLGIVLTSFAVRVEELIREGGSLALQVRAPLAVPRDQDPAVTAGGYCKSNFD